MYTLEYTNTYRKSFKKLGRAEQVRIADKVNALAADPKAASNVTPLQGRAGYRMRVGGYRVIFDMEESKLVILLLEVGKRGDIYK
jgi:mRNA interferase RelE/StbE